MWEAANAPSGLSREGDIAADGASQALLPEDSSRHQHHKHHRHQHQGRIARRVVSSETIEAALSRLSKAYTTSIECIGAINNTNRMILQQEKKHPENNISKSTDVETALQTIQKVSNVARTTFERAILLDPLVLPHLPTLHQSMIELSNKKIDNDDEDDDSFRWKAVQERRPTPPSISSAAHKSTLVKLAYLSLVNYSDLLLQSSSTPNVDGGTTTILDRGIVPKLRTTGCWGSEDPQETHRLAVAALCDAANLDGTDPITWLKLACASRSLERTIASTSGSLWTTVERSQHRRLQRKALERGSLALPTHVPPNRTIVRALQEFHNEPEPKEYVSKPFTPPLVSKKLELTRYSWSVLGKMILRACKGEEVNTLPWEVSSYSTHQTRSNNSTAALFGSPTVAMQLSPMLVLPSRVLGTICQYLENASIWRFEATCRALSVNIISARASMEHHESDHEEDDDEDDAADLLLRRQEQRQKEQLLKIQNRSSQSDPESTESNQPQGGGNGTEGTSTAETKTNKETSTNNNNRSNSQGGTKSARQPSVPPRQSSRTSQRVRSKQLTTGKKQDREAKRNSFNYCFLAATLSCTKEKHNEMTEELLKGNEFDYLFRGREDMSRVADGGGKRKGRNRMSSYDGSGEKSMDAIERVSEGSLSCFVEKWSANNSGPMDLLGRYLAHVAMFADEVFESDSLTMGLHSCILSLFQSLLLRSGSYQSIIPRFFRSITETGSFCRTLELFAMDLIHAELIFRQCDRHSPKIVEFDDDANLIALMIPSLVEACDEIKQKLEDDVDRELCTKFCLLQVRCYWLTASFYLWRSRIARAIYLSREAEDEGIHFIGMTIDSFDSHYLQSIKSVKTPHLVSPGRQDPYWREVSPISLVKFRDEIQASSVVSHARQQFQELVSNLKKVENAEGAHTEISTNDANDLSGIGRKLFERYNAQYGSANSKLSELVNNFLEMRGEDFFSGNTSEGSSKLQNEVLIQREPYRVEDLQRVSDPTILSMLVICLNIDEKQRPCLTELLVRLVLSTIDMHRSLINQIADSRSSQKQTDGYHSDDAMSDSDDDMSDGGPLSSGKDGDEKKARQCGHFVKFLVSSLCEVVLTHLKADKISELFASSEFGSMIEAVLDFSNRWFQSTVNYLSIPHDSVDKDLIRLIEKLLTGHGKAKVNPIVQDQNESILFRGLVKILISQQDLLKSLVTSQVDRSRRAARQRTCISRAEYIGLVASKLGSILSLNLSSVDDFVMRRGRLFEQHMARKEKEERMNALTYQEAILFLRSVRWLRKYAFQDDGEALKNSQANATNSFDRPVTKELKIPIATLAIGICGSSSCSRQSSDSDVSAANDSQENSTLSLTEFYDSDASMNDWLSDSEEDNKSEKSKKELVRVICHSVHCISLICDMIDQKETLNRFLDVDCDNEFGPLLPMVSARVLNFFADTLLVKFGDSDGNNRQNLWLEEYPFHTKYIGERLDTTLHKCYRWLYGFALVGEQNHQSTAGSELAHAINPITEIAEKNFKLENTTAAGQLYRCVVRAYAGGRRTAPKQALEVVSAALPPLRESEQSKALRRFVLAADNADLDMDSLLKMQNNWDSAFRAVRDSIVQNKDVLENSVDASLEELEAMQVRRGISKQLALGPLPIVSTDQKQKSDTATDDDRAQTICNEIAITKKFNAIFNDLCLMDANNWEGWYRASQCCVLKADAIADRLGLTLGFSRSKNFSIPGDRGLSSRSMNISDLQEEQDHEENISKQIDFLGDDYSVYMNCQWSSFSSLRDCVATIKKRLVENTEADHNTNKNIPFLIWEEIESKYEKGDFVEFQETCGGIFVKALRGLAVRCMSIALYILQSKTETSSDLKVLLSDVCETLGNNFYSSVMASQSYGWPMLVTTMKRKRKLATIAKSCYQASIRHADDSVEEDDDINNHSTWDLQFMVGKCLEKIACTYDEEKFSHTTEAVPQMTRLYEQHMSEAMSVYANALAEATKLEYAGTQLPDQAGGSAHGSTEILYRLHASRLKCLIRAVSRNEEEREQAQLEALRLTEKYRFKVSDDSTLGEGPNDRLWAVFVDIVDGLAECRKLKPFFHRSVFRHAQALMWSPLFYDPSSSKTSKDTFPATHGAQLASLEPSKPVAFSAMEVISTLFDKKRSQLCAVWVTNAGAASPFQAMNSTIRKYDSLRGKYIGAYLEALHLCNRRSETETFLKWLYGSKRDLPSTLRAGAMNDGEKPTISHVQDPLLMAESGNSSLMSQGFLLSSKRRANSLLADILIHEVSNLTSVAASKQSSDGLKVSEVYLKNAYACYLRLNCSIEGLKRLRAFKYGSNSIREVDALCQTYLCGGENGEESLSGNDFGDWTGGGRKLAIFKNALSKCKKLFPTLSGHNFFGKSKVKKAKSTQASVPDPDDNQQSPKKRKAPSSNDSLSDKSVSEENTKKVSFEVAVPTGLKSGDTFLTSVKVADSEPIKVKLTVPEGNHSTLRFNLKVPKSPKQTNKKAKVVSS